MSDVRLLGLGRAAPARRYTQDELFAHNPWEGHPLVERLFLESPIQTRALFVPPDWYAGDPDLTQTNAAWREGALLLGGRALTDALEATGTAPSALDLLAVTSVTGYTTPGLDLLLARAHGLRRDIARAHFNCIGCHAAVPLLRVAVDHVRARPTTRAAALAVEICSACFRPDDDPQNLVAASLFGDGAAAAVVGTDGEGPAIVDFASVYDFDHLDALGFGLDARGFRIVLDPSVPEIVGRHVGSVVDALLDRHGVRRDRVSRWCFHPGGSRILDAVQTELQLDDHAMRASRRVLRAWGNMSSPSVLFVLAEALVEPPPPDTWGVVAAFGPGLGIEAALLRFDGPSGRPRRDGAGAIR